MSQTASTQDILQEIRADIADAGEQCSYPDFDHFWLRRHGALNTTYVHPNLLFETAALDDFHEVAYYRELPATGFRGRVFNFVKRVLRKLMKFLLVPMVEDQNRINANLDRTLQHVRIYINAQQAYTKQLEQRLAVLSTLLPPEAREDALWQTLPKQEQDEKEDEACD